MWIFPKAAQGTTIRLFDFGNGAGNQNVILMFTDPTWPSYPDGLKFYVFPPSGGGAQTEYQFTPSPGAAVTPTSFAHFALPAILCLPACCCPASVSSWFLGAG